MNTGPVKTCVSLSLSVVAALQGTPICCGQVECRSGGDGEPVPASYPAYPLFQKVWQLHKVFDFNIWSPRKPFCALAKPIHPSHFESKSGCTRGIPCV